MSRILEKKVVKKVGFSPVPYCQLQYMWLLMSSLLFCRPPHTVWWERLFHSFTFLLAFFSLERSSWLKEEAFTATQPLQQQIPWLKSRLCIPVPLLVIRWQGSQFRGGEILHCTVGERTTPCGHFVIQSWSHLWAICRDNGHVCPCLALCGVCEYIALYSHVKPAQEHH